VPAFSIGKSAKTRVENTIKGGNHDERAQQAQYDINYKNLSIIKRDPSFTIGRGSPNRFKIYHDKYEDRATTPHAYLSKNH